MTTPRENTSTNTSAIERLQMLPPLFKGGDLTVRFQWTSKTASQYLYLWKKRGLVQGLGGHSDVYANLLAQPKPDWEQALLLAMPSATIVGVEALRRAGWTTQIEHRPSVAVNARERVFQSAHFNVQRRSDTWFQAVRHGLQTDHTPGVPQLHAAWALADMLKLQDWGACGLWPDDIDWDTVEQNASDNEAQWQAACLAIKLPLRSLLQMAERGR